MVARDRGQLLLLGGLAIAIVFLTAIPLSNSLVVSESASSSETVSDIDSAAQREAAVERGIRTLLSDVNTSNKAALNRSLRNFSRYYTNVSAQQDGVYVNASLNVSASPGGLVNNSDSANFKSKSSYYYNGTSNDNDWNLTEDATRISEFRMTLTKVPSNSPNFTVKITNASSHRWTLRVSPVTSDNKTIWVRNSSSGTWRKECEGRKPIDLDLQAGTCSTDTESEQFDSYSEFIEGPYTVRFENGHVVNRGSYRLGAVGTFPNGNGNTVVVPAVDLRYVGPSLSYTDTIQVNETT